MNTTIENDENDELLDDELDNVMGGGSAFKYSRLTSFEDTGTIHKPKSRFSFEDTGTIHKPKSRFSFEDTGTIHKG